MADQKISALTADTGLASGDLVPFVDISDTTMAATGTTKKATVTDLMALAPVQSVAGKTGAVTLVPTDAGAAAASHSHAESDVTSLTTDLATKITKPTDAAGWLHDNGAGTLAWTTPTSTDVGAQPSNTTLTSLAGLANAAGKLTNDGSGGLSWAAGGGGGQTLVTKVVAASGGDYTTLGAALAAASDGWVIWLAPGTYTETANITSASNNITVIGAGRDATLLAMSTHTLRFNGDNVTLRDLSMTDSSGAGAICLYMNGAYYTVNNVQVKATAAGGSGNFVFLNGSYGQIVGCRFIARGDDAAVFVGGNYHTITNNWFELDPGSAMNHDGFLDITGSYHTLTGNHFYQNQSSGFGNHLVWLESTGTNNTFTGNQLYNGATTINYKGVRVGGSSNIVNANAFNAFPTGITVSGTSTSSIVTSNSVTSCTTGVSDAGTTTSLANNV